MERQTIARTPGAKHRREFATAAEAFKVAAMLGTTGSNGLCKLGRDPGKPWHVEFP